MYFSSVAKRRRDGRLHFPALFPVLVGFLSAGSVLVGQSGPPQFTVKTWAGNGTNGFAGDGGTATDAQLSSPFGIAMDSSGNLYIADQVNQRIRRRGADGSITTLAGTGTASFSGDGGSASAAQLSTPCGVFVDSSGNIYVADSGNSVIRRFLSGGNISTIAGKNDLGGQFAGDGAAATSAALNKPRAVVMDKSGVLYIADSGNDRIRTVSSSGTINTIAGNGAKGYAGDGGPATSAALFNPQGLAVDGDGNLFIADTFNHCVRKVAKDGTITTVAGTGTRGYSGDGGLASKALLNFPTGVALDPAGNLYIADSDNSRIRVVIASGSIWTVAGTGAFADGGENIPAADAALRFPLAVTTDAGGNLYVADTQNNRIRQLAPLANLDQLPVIAMNGVVQSTSFGGFSSIAPGAWIEIYGDRLAGQATQWSPGDFTGDRAPTSLGGTSVSIAGKAAYLSFVSPKQINALVPRGVCFGLCQVTVTNTAGTSAKFSVDIKASQPGLLAPPLFEVDGRRYLGAVAGDGVTYVLPTGGVAGIPSRPARPGEVITIYGTGFGTVTPFVDFGDRATGPTALTSALKVAFNDAPAKIDYAGLLPGSVGIYQFNVVVPEVPDGDAVRVTFTLDGVAGSQSLYSAVKTPGEGTN